MYHYQYFQLQEPNIDKVLSCKNICYEIAFYSVDLEDDSEEGGSVSNSTPHMVRGTLLLHNQNIFHYGLPSPLLYYFRRIQNSQLHTKTLVSFCIFCLFNFLFLISQTIFINCLTWFYIVLRSLVLVLSILEK